jgi:hypothetical protein
MRRRVILSVEIGNGRKKHFWFLKKDVYCNFILMKAGWVDRN